MGLTCHQDQFYLSERCHRYTLPLQRQSTKSSIGWYKKLPCKESQKEILPLNYQTCMDKFDISTILFVRVPNCSPNCTGVLCKTTSQTSRLAGSCQEVCCQTISTLYLMKSQQVTGGYRQGRPSHPHGPEKNSLRWNRRRFGRKHIETEEGSHE